MPAARYADDATMLPHYVLLIARLLPFAMSPFIFFFFLLLIRFFFAMPIAFRYFFFFTLRVQRCHYIFAFIFLLRLPPRRHVFAP